jgi:hypothetical protein
MIVKDTDVTALIHKVADQYNNNIATRFIRPLLNDVLSEEGLVRGVTALTERTDSLVAQGIHIDELYSLILSMARFVYLVRQNVMPNMRSQTGGPGTDANRIYREMAMNNFSANVSVLADLINELYLKAVAYDKAHCPKGTPVYKEIAGLAEIGRYLVK